MILKINDVKIGQRVRDEYGDMESLTNSIRDYGLLHPIVIDANYNLIAGCRRLLACERIGMKEIEAKMLGEISERELRVLELEENIRRKDLTELEKSKNLVELAGLKEQELKEKAANELLSESDTNSRSVGRPKEIVSLKSVAEELNVPRVSLIDAKQHVTAVSEFPELEEFPKYKAIETAKELRQAPEEEREKILDFAQRKTQTVSSQKDADYGSYIDECWKLIKKYHKAMSAYMWIKADEKEFKMLSEIIDADTAGTHLRNVEDAISKLARVRTFMKGVIDHGENKNFRI
ncbi:ParB N-terminal domain-containing protein [Lacrimispora sp. 38-1]|uniref:ParB N-terminal domain-containing protein n=1 Tax=Lacrimispora sp. 38-1 TaxID=3125778 RepID=UPI003CF106CF